MTGLYVAFGGLGGDVFSSGLDDIEKTLLPFDVVTRFYRWSQGRKAALEAMDHDGPIFVAWHSAGAKASSDFAKAFGKPIDIGISVDAWLPGVAVAENYKRVISIQADRMGRFHMHGANVVDKIVIEGTTHTTVDDSKQLHELIRREIVSVMKGPNMETPFYIGEGEQVSEAELARLASDHEIPPYLALAATYIESKDLEGSWSSGALVALYEDHIAYKYSSGKVRDALVKARLAARGWRDLPYPPSPYPQIDRCTEIAGPEVAALSTSWGMYQVMGFNFQMLGFDSALDLVEYLKASEKNQFMAWVKTIDEMGVRDALLAEDWAGYARRYNGPKYAAHGYHTRLSALAAKYKEKYGTGLLPPVDTPQLPDIPADPPHVPTPGPGQLTLEALRGLPTQALTQAIRQASDVIKMATIVIDERQSESGAESSGEIALKGDATIGVEPVKQIWKMIGAVVGIAVSKAVGAGILPPEVADAAQPVLQGFISPQTVFDLVFAGLGAYFAPRNVYSKGS